MVTYPSDWKEGTIGDLFNVSAGGDVKKRWFSKYRTQSHPYEIFSNGIENRGLYGYTSTAIYARNAVTVTARGTIGQAFYRENDFDAIIRLLVLSPKNDNTKPKFYEYFINSQVVFEKENTGVPQLTAPKIKEKTVPVLSGEEQKAIIAALSTFDTYIADLAELIEKKRGIRDGALEDLMCQRTQLSDYPTEWEKVPLSEICQVYDGTHQTPKYTPQGIRFISVENILDIYGSNKYISHVAYDSDFKAYPEKGDILMTRIGDIGTPCVVDREEPLAYYVSLALFKNISINSYFLNYYLMSSGFQRELDDRSLHHATPKKINKDEIGKCKVKYPKDADEQAAVANILRSMDEEIEALEIERDKMIQIREGAMDDLLTGRVRLKV